MPEGTNGNGGIRISNREIYDALMTVKDDVRDLKNDVKELNDLRNRIRSLEIKFYGVLAGLIAALGLILKTGQVI